MRLLCPKCETWYSGRHFKPGELCGDYTVTKPLPCSGLLVDLALAAEAVNIAYETGRTPKQLADDRAELIELCKEAMELFSFARFDNGVYSPDGKDEGRIWGNKWVDRLREKFAKWQT